MTSNEPIPVILDVDTGYDDALALMLAVRSPRLEVLGVTCVHGNQQLNQVVVNTLKVLDVAEAPNIPVAAGMRQPLLEAVQPPSLIHGHDGMGDLGLPPSTRQLADVHAIELLRQLLTEAVVPITLIALAPLTNIAVLLRMYPEVRSKIAGLTIMGGTFIAPGNTSPLAEFNVRVDPEAAAIVLQSGLPIRLYPLDVFRQIHFDRAEIGQFKASSDPMAQAVAGIMTYACNYFQAEYSLIGDAGAVATVIEPEATVWERYPVMVELAGLAGRGQTVFDRRSARQRSKADEWWQPVATEIEVATSLDVQRYRRLFAEAVDQTWSNS